MKTLTKDQVKRVSKQYGVDFIIKDRSTIMQIASAIVPIFSKIDKKEFMEYYVTTLFDNIYYSDDADLEFDLVVHELTHVVQFRNGSFIRYVTLAGRGYLEGMAKCAEIELMLAVGEKYDIKEKAEMLLEYGLGQEEVDVVTVMMKATEKSFLETGDFSSAIAKDLVKMFNETA